MKNIFNKIKVFWQEKEVFNKLKLLLISAMLGALTYYKTYYTKISFEELFFSLFSDTTGTSFFVIKDMAFKISFLSILFYLIFIFIFIKADKKINKNKNLVINLLFILSLIFSLAQISFFRYGFFQLQETDLYEKYYVNPQEVKLSFPEEKKNLIHIYLESVESNLFSQEAGGAFENSIIPELEKISQNNLSFTPNKNYLSGIYMPRGCSWTIAGMICQSSGIHLAADVSIRYPNEDYFKNIISLGNILEEQDYTLSFILGSEARFNGRDKFYTYHGNYRILDYNKAKENQLIPKDYRVNWGFEDSKLFEFSKKELLKMDQDKAFAMTILTSDSHFPNGYLDPSCSAKHDVEYLNAFSCTSKLLNDFLNWLEKQDFYDETVIVITGDHLSMQDKIYGDKAKEDRYLYNSFINTKEAACGNYKKASSFDIFPSILGALDVQIENQRLGLGTNLFSCQETLLDELGEEKLDELLSKRSKLYYETLLK